MKAFFRTEKSTFFWNQLETHTSIWILNYHLVTNIPWNQFFRHNTISWWMYIFHTSLCKVCKLPIWSHEILVIDATVQRALYGNCGIFFQNLVKSTFYWRRILLFDLTEKKLRSMHTVHSVEIAESYCQTFLTKISWK